MPELYEFVLDKIFCGFVCRDPDLLRAIDAFEGALDVHQGALRFTPPALYEFACRSYEATSGPVVRRDRDGYLRFRKALYQNPTNSHLGALGGQVELQTPNPNHDLAVYKLVRTRGAC
jgi:hypothetical protein